MTSLDELPNRQTENAGINTQGIMEKNVRHLVGGGDKHKTGETDHGVINDGSFFYPARLFQLLLIYYMAIIHITTCQRLDTIRHTPKSPHSTLAPELY